MLTYDLKARGETPKYYCLYTNIKNDIISGAIPSGSKLPSKRSLAEHLGVSVITVDTAYSCLVEEGYVTSRERSGFFVSNITPQTAMKRTESRITLISDPHTEQKSGMGFRYSALTKIMREVITEYGSKLLGNPPPLGCAELRNAIAEYLLRYRGMIAQPERIIIGSGAEYLYDLIVQLLGTDVVYGIENPSYEKIRLVYSAHGAVCELLDLDEDGISTEALGASQAGVLHVTPYHSFPSGISAPASKRYEYLAWAEKRGGLIIEDDFDSEFSLNRTPLETVYSMDKSGCVIYMNTFSHSLAPSMRMGYMILPDRLMDLYKKKLGFYTCSVPLFDQYVLAKFISQGFFERYLNRVRRKLRRNE